MPTEKNRPTIKNLNEFVEKIDDMKKVNPADLSSDQDLSIAIMNLISIEEHLFFSGAKTGDTSFYDLINPIRENRKELLAKIIKKYKGEVWCISKHLLATCMRLSEVGTKAIAAGKKEEAYDLFNRAYDMYCLFWGLNLDAVTGDDAKELIKEKDPETIENINKDDESITDFMKKENSTGAFSKFKNFVTDKVNCCKE